ncbi:6-bladed beta-propeller [Parabacteroides sp. OttesenSCG-928-J18]|nr:6-bladed beta-propeller [Parabacteroides sp. OttesenSCG-928-J18]
MKNNTQNIYVLLWIVITLSSCTEKQDKAVQSTISLKEVQGETSHDELFEIVDCTPMEASSTSLMGDIDKMQVYQNKYYILDKITTKKVFVFNFDGSFSHSIGSIGSGPGEYINIQDFTIDKENEQIVLLTTPSLVYIYDMAGSFLHSKKIGDPLFWSICSSPEGFVCSTNEKIFTEEGNTFQLFSFDKEFNLKGKNISLPPEQIAFLPFITNPLIDTKKEIAYFDNFTSTLSLFPYNAIQEIQSFHFELNDAVPGEAWSNPQLFINNQRNYSFFLEAYVIDSTLWAFIVNKGKIAFLKFNTKTGEKVFNDYQDFFPKILTYDDGYFYSSLSPTSILEGEDRQYPLNPSAIHPLEEDGNMVIVKYKLK